MNQTKTDIRSLLPYLDYAFLFVAWALVRIPFLGAFDLVSHDGCYYIAQARALLAGNPGAGGAFPPGYPLLIAAALPVISDGVRAAQCVSALAALAATVALYALARVYLPRVPALLCAIVFTTTPAFVHSSLATMSESLYAAWLIVAMAAYARDRRVSSGIALGAAAITRPEALGIAAILVGVDAWRNRAWGSTLSLALPFVGLYSLNVLVPALGGVEASVVPKIDQLGLGARGWRAAETGGGGVATSALLTHYFSRLPVDLALLFRHAAGLGLVLAVIGLVRRPVVAMVALVPVVVNPLFTLRPETRFIVTFLPFVILFAFLGAFAVASHRTRKAVIALLVVAAGVGAFVNRAELTVRSPETAAARDAALMLREKISPGATIADRKPFLAHYLDARYIEIPGGDYDATIEELVERGVHNLALSTGVIDYFRPQLAPLLYDEATITGELRLTQIYADDAGVSVFGVRSCRDPYGTTLVRAQGIESPRWNRAGDLVYAAGPARARRMHAVTPGDTTAPTDPSESLALEDGFQATGIAPTPDGRRFAFVSSRDGNPDVFMLEVRSGNITPLTRNRARDVDPAWDGSGRIVFASDRSGRFELYRLDANAGEGGPEQLGLAGRRPRLSPDGSTLAWSRGGGGTGLRELETGRERVLPSPHRLASAPAWSHDSRYLAVSATDQGSADVYIVDISSGRSLRLTKDTHGVETAPDWHPSYYRLAYAAGERRPDRIVVLDKLSLYMQTFEAERPRVHTRPR